MSLRVRPLKAEDLPVAREIFRQAFASFLQIPEAMVGDGDMPGFRLRAYPEAAFAAEYQGQVVAAGFVARRGTQFVPGPVITRPRGWTGNAGQLLMEAILSRAEGDWGCRQAVGYTFATSPRHIEFYRKLGFYPRFLTATLGLPLRPEGAGATLETYAGLSESARREALGEIAALTGTLYEGFDWSNEAEAIHAQQAGDTILLFKGSRLEAVALCHAGPGSEAATGSAIIKFAAVRPGANRHQTFEQLISHCRAWAAGRKLKSLSIGVNLACKEAYQHLVALGFLVQVFGVALHRPDHPAHLLDTAYVFDDGR